MSAAYLECADESCRQRYPLDNREHLCATCGGLLDVRYDFAPVASADAAPDLGATKDQQRGGRSERRLALSRAVAFRAEGEDRQSFRGPHASDGSAPHRRMGGRRALAIKHQGNNPTGSFKDLGMTACITQAAAVGSRVTACASTGNTSASMAAYAARAGMKAVVFVPFGKISAAKLAQALEFGAVVIEIGDNFDQAFHMLRALTEEMGLYLVNSLNPFRLEGQKTIVLRNSGTARLARAGLHRGSRRESGKRLGDRQRTCWN